jgi:2-polyprenyl-3-methyl-5-hydroxy-6-metoxy-1,4-benzoquinol methylase
MYGDGVYRVRARTCRPLASVRHMYASGGWLTASRVAWPNLWFNFARLLPRSSVTPMAVRTGHRSTSPGATVSLVDTRMMSLMSQVVAGVPSVVTGVPSVVIGVPSVVTGAPSVVTDVPHSWEALRTECDALQQVLHTVTDRNRTVYDALANEYNQKAPKHRTTTHDRVNRVAKYVAPGSEILDVGCGVGLALSILAEKKFNATGVDVSPRMAELASERSPHTPVIRGDFLTANLPATYDAIWEQALLHLFPSVTEGVIFERFRTLLKPDGILSLSTTVSETRGEGWGTKRDYGPAPVRYRRSITEADLATAFTKHGFEFVESWVTTDPFGKDWRTVVGRKQ